jgi:N-methylhydantoinase B
VRRDVLEGYVSVAVARDAYGVVIGDDGEIDDEATRNLRAGSGQEQA